MVLAKSQSCLAFVNQLGYVLILLCLTRQVICTVPVSDSDNNDASSVAMEKDDNEPIEPFVATNEWQEIKPGQAIPRGLHVKMDINNGGKWAKLMDENSDEDRNALAQIPSNKNEELKDSSESGNVPKYRIDELKKALKNFKQENKSSLQPDDEQAKKSFRSLDELKEAFDQLDLQQETDVEVMKRLVATLTDAKSSIEAKYVALQDLEYYVHQIDNANDLVTFGGFDIVHNTLNDTDVTLREEAAHVIGSAMQSNPKVQIKAIESGVLSKLLFMLSSQHEPMTVRKKCIYALSAMLRHFPLAQIKFAEHGGFAVLLELFSQQNMRQLHIKAIRLLNDITVERNNAKAATDDPQIVERRKQYNRVPMQRLINELGWCDAISSLLTSQSHSERETVLDAMRNMHVYCASNFQTQNVTVLLKTLKEEYKQLSDEEREEGEADGYFKLLFDITDSVLATCKLNSSSKDEL
ncbi:nucleotide exchange factor SIL1-like [Clavelina lepadiformis]|uniref:nucleotide exchange factor SIL1-like n=1 Tax=Clavelina lepadiformis TaxID=159417 RepID=UPI004042FE9B